MKKWTVLTLLATFALLSKADDMVILRSAEEITGNIDMISEGRIIIYTDNGEMSIPTDQVYMIKYETRGNAFFNPHGKMRYDSEHKTRNLGDKEIGIYLSSGDEVIASAIRVDEENINYKLSKKDLLSGVSKIFSKKNKEWIKLPKEQVFIVKYADGSKEVITPLIKEDTQLVTALQPSATHVFVAIDKAKEYPYPGNVTLPTKEVIPAIIYDITGNYIYYRLKSWQDGPIFRVNIQ